MSFFGTIGSILSGAGAIASVIPGGQIFGAAAAIGGSLLKGSTPSQAITQQQQQAAIVTPAKPASLMDKVLAPGPLGIPWLVYGVVLAGVGYLIYRKMRKR